MRELSKQTCTFYEPKVNLQRPSMRSYREYSAHTERRRLNQFYKSQVRVSSPHGYDDGTAPRAGATPHATPTGFESTPHAFPKEYGSGYSNASPATRKAPPMTPNSAALSLGHQQLLDLFPTLG